MACCHQPAFHAAVQEFNAVVLDTKSTILEYHKREGDPQASVTPWQDDERVITFAVPLTGVPEVIKTAIGDEDFAMLSWCTPTSFLQEAVRATTC